MPEQTKKTNLDVFVTRSVYPDPESVFTAHYKSLEEIKETCYVVLDTNTLLVPYTTSKESLKQIEETYRTLIGQERLIVPAQVAREFAKNRASKIGEVFQQLSRNRDSSGPIQTGKYPLLEAQLDYQNSLKLEVQINKLITDYRETIGRVLDHVRGWTWNDPVSLLYGELFAKGVVKDAPVDDDATRVDLERRQLHKIPPGYKDSAKDDQGIGDLLIWQTILDVGRTTTKSVIFVSHDEKADWWHRSNDQALYPRYELLDEFRRASEGETFHIVRFSKFLDLFGASEPVVKEIKEKETEQTRSGASRFWHQRHTETAIVDWLRNRFPDLTVKAGRDVPLVVAKDDGSIVLLVEIKVFTNPRNFARRLRELSMKLEVTYLGYSKMLLVLVGGDDSIAALLVSEAAQEKFTSRAMVVVGHLSEENEFIPIYSNDAAFIMP